MYHIAHNGAKLKYNCLENEQKTLPKKTQNTNCHRVPSSNYNVGKNHETHKMIPWERILLFLIEVYKFFAYS